MIIFNNPLNLQTFLVLLFIKNLDVINKADAMCDVVLRRET